MSRSSSRLLPTFCLILAMILWSSTFITLKIAFRSYDPMVVIFGRMLVASLCAVFFPKVFRNIGFRMKDLKYFLFMVVCEPCLYFVFEAKALQFTTASQAGMITTMMPLLVAVAAVFFLGERMTLRTCLGFSVAVAGALWLSVSSEASSLGPNPLLGNFLEFMAMVCATGYAISLKKLTDRYSSLFLTFVQAFAGAVFFFPALFFPSTTLPDTFVAAPFFSILYLGSAVTLGAYGLYNFGVSRLPASQASAYINLIPVFTLFLSWLFLGETFTMTQYMASGMVFAGVIMSQGGGSSEPELAAAQLETGS